MCLQPIVRVYCEDRQCRFNHTAWLPIKHQPCAPWCNGTKTHRRYTPPPPQKVFSYQILRTYQCPECIARHEQRLRRSEERAEADFNRLVRQLPPEAHMNMAARKAWEAQQVAQAAAADKTKKQEEEARVAELEQNLRGMHVREQTDY